MRRAFTLVELLVVISVFVLLLAIAVPAFSSVLYSSEQALAENSLRIGLQAARDAALRNPAGRDSAAVFLFDRFTGRTSILPCTSAGMLRDADPAAARGGLIDREVFVPVVGFEPVQMPRSWNVRGYAAPGMTAGAWYDVTYNSSAARMRGNWVFPESGFYDETAGDDGEDRQTFMVRFEGSTGVLKLADPGEVLVVAPSPEISFRNAAPWNYTDPAGLRPYRVDQESDPARFVRRVVCAPAIGPGLLSVQSRQIILGDVSSDTVLARAVSQVAVYSEKRLAQALGVRTDTSTGCLYKNLDDPELVDFNGSPLNDQYLIYINDWVEGHLNMAGQDKDSDCRVFALQKYLGTLQEVTGTRNGLGVTSQ